MVDENQFDERVSENDQLEQALVSMALRRSSLDRDRLLFLAGQASVERARRDPSWRRWAWPAATAMSTVTAVILAAMLFAQSRSTGNIDRSSALQNTAQTEKPTTNSKVIEKVRSSNTPDAATFATNEAWPWSRLRSFPTSNAAQLGEPSNYLQLRTVVLAHGVNALPAPRAANVKSSIEKQTNAPQSRQELLDELLNSDSRRQDNRL